MAAPIEKAENIAVYWFFSIHSIYLEIHTFQMTATKASLKQNSPTELSFILKNHRFEFV